MSFRIRIKQRELPDGRVSIWAAGVIMQALRIALRSEAAAFSARRSAKGRMSKAVRQSIGVSLTAVEPGSGVMVFESEASAASAAAFDVPRHTFDGLIREIDRSPQDRADANVALQRALLSLDVLFHRDSDVESIELVADDGRRAKLDRETMKALRETVEERLGEEEAAGSAMLTGRLLEVDLAAKTFRVHAALGQPATVEFSDAYEALVTNALNQFVSVEVTVRENGRQELLTIEPVDGIPPSRFSARRSIAHVAAEQEVRPIADIAALALDDPDAVSLEEFTAFLQSTRRS